MKYELGNFVDLDSGSNLKYRDAIHVCKRKNNNKRDYLFVNSLQGKHVPCKPSDTFDMMLDLYDKLYEKLKDKKNILLVGFAETATALGQIIAYYSWTCKDKPLDVVRYLQTTRESLSAERLINFEEEHSHATTQSLYYSGEDFEFDTVVFIEDEITTGNTIINFIKEFNKIHTCSDYYVASVCNWQTEENRQKFNDHHVHAVSLLSGTLKEDISVITLTENATQRVSAVKCVDNTKDVGTGLTVGRLGFSREEFFSELSKLDSACNDYKVSFGNNGLVLNGLRLAVIGTEENMFAPMYIGQLLEMNGVSVMCRATTRSPITPSDESILHTALELQSNYDRDRTVYLYNTDECRDNTDAILLIEDGLAKNRVVFDSLVELYGKKGLTKLYYWRLY